jgi:hypothetical protein
VGAISFSLDNRLAKSLRSALPITTLVETGTFRGDTVAACLNEFDEIISIEHSEELHEKARRRFAGQSSVTLLCGHSPDCLRELSASLKKKSVFFWLDSHWCAGAGSSEARASQCPLLDELDAIGQLNAESVIAIDDARYFLSPPPSPHRLSEWPSFQAILEGLNFIAPHHKITVVNDVILSVPAQGQQETFRYARNHGVDWLAIANNSRSYDALLVQLQEKEAVIQGLSAEREKLRMAIHHPIRLLVEAYGTRVRQSVASLTQRERALRDKEALLHRMMKPRSLQGVEEELHRLKEKVERLEQASPQLSTSGRKPVTNLRRLLGPRIGRLQHHAPRPLRLPSRYYVERAPARLPKISVVVPSFNQARFLEHTLESLFQQEYSNLEPIVIDGGSTDGSVDILRRHSSKLASWRSEPDEGQAAAINKGMSRATGEIMGYLNSDDVLVPGTLTYVARIFEQNPKVDVVYGHRILIDENGFEIGRWVLPPHDSEILSWADYVPQETLFWRRSIWERSGAAMDESFRFALDWELLLRFRKTEACFARLPRFLGCFRVHGGQKTSSQIEGFGLLEMTRCRESALGRPTSRTEILSAVRPYLWRSLLYHLMYRCGILAY